MPRLIELAEDDRQIELGELAEALECGPFDPDDEESFVEYAPALKKLANNRRFLGDLVVEELKQRCAGQLKRNHYSAQVILLHSGSKKFILRANFWPSAHDSVVVNSGSETFFYGVPHDHNFTFLTVGYLGPGYWSDYYEYDYKRVAGFIGEKVDLRFVERSRLSEGKMLLYRKHCDVHMQLPPEELSVSLNILAVSQRSDFLDQYRFDLERSEITSIVNPSSLEALIPLAGLLGGENGHELVDTFAERHPSDRIRFAAVKAQAAAAGGVDRRLAVYEKAASLPNLYVSAMAKREAERIERCRSWLEAAPAFSHPPLS